MFFSYAPLMPMIYFSLPFFNEMRATNCTYHTFRVCHESPIQCICISMHLDLQYTNNLVDVRDSFIVRNK